MTGAKEQNGLGHLGKLRGPCPTCGKQFRSRSVKAKFCSHGCAGASRRRPSTVGERVWKYIRLGAPEECWPWIGATFTESGYGMIQDRTTTLGAHRAVWASINGPIPAGHIIMHTCDNRPCCNPAHLKLGTYRENTLDMIAKGRGRMQFEAAQRRLEVAAMREEAAEVIQEND